MMAWMKSVQIGVYQSTGINDDMTDPEYVNLLADTGQPVLLRRELSRSFYEHFADSHQICPSEKYSSLSFRSFVSFGIDFNNAVKLGFLLCPV
jgi:hypothetical protein